MIRRWLFRVMANQALAMRRELIDLRWQLYRLEEGGADAVLIAEVERKIAALDDRYQKTVATIDENEMPR